MTQTITPTPLNPLPNGPNSSPAWQLLQWIGQPIALMESCHQQYGDIFTLRLSGLGPLVFCSHPQAIQEIFTADPKHFDSGQSNQLMQPLLGDASVILLDGDRHQQQRQLLMPPFHGERMRTYGDLMVKITRQVTAGWRAGQTFNVREPIQNISLQVILQAVFGVTDPQRYQALLEILPSMLDRVSSPITSSFLFIPVLQRDWGDWSPWGKFVRQRSHLNQLIYQEIAERRAHFDPERTDILTLMLSARDGAGQPMTDGELRDELMTLLLAGHETTASAITWALYWIAKLPHIQERLVADLSAYGDLNDAKTLMRLPYLSALCNETLRIYPVAPITFPRILKVPMTVMGQDFAPGTRLTPCIYLTHHRHDLYPNPQTFCPERFLEKTFSPYEFIAFGGSDRRCIGMAFALFEMKQVLATLLTQFRFEFVGSRSIKPVRRGVTLAPPKSLQLYLAEHL
ncbi:MAG: cytochrome P450 [Acaryochloridaceae cyanobacterium RU_4_10]|nr:cytochrome P450 [Acaryochloridaceae cyanobacterium RU_4_10]